MKRKLTDAEAGFLPLALIILFVLYGLVSADQARDEELEARYLARISAETQARYKVQYAVSGVMESFEVRP